MSKSDFRSSRAYSYNRESHIMWFGIFSCKISFETMEQMDCSDHSSFEDRLGLLDCDFTEASPCEIQIQI